MNSVPKSQSESDIHIRVENELLKAENTQLKMLLNNMKAENENLNSELASLKNLYDTACKNYIHKDFAAELVKKKCVPAKLSFSDHKENLGEMTITQLRKIKGDKRSDSTFILTCVKKLFENNSLKYVTACGRNMSAIMLPEKRQIINDLFVERLAREQIRNEELNERHKRMNTLINSAINNILRVKFHFE